MIKELSRILDLQADYSSTNTPSMQERGELIRNGLPAALEGYLVDFAQQMEVGGEDLSVEGSDGKGRKTPTPWVRIFSKSRSPRATEGFYVVIHFSADGQNFYVTVGCSSSEWKSDIGDLVQVAPEEIDRRVLWVLQTLESADVDTSDFSDQIELRCNLPLARSFERATALTSTFNARNINEGQFVECLGKACRMLGAVYRGFDAGSNLTAKQIDDAVLESILNPNRKTTGGRQGFRMSACERKAIELRAMEVTRDYLISHGFEVTDTSSNNPFDFMAVNGEKVVKVEVKGSTSNAVDSVLMTANEVRLHQEENGSTALAVVSGIELVKEPTAMAKGGSLEFIDSWQIDDWELQPMTYQVKRKSN